MKRISIFLILLMVLLSVLVSCGQSKKEAPIKPEPTVESLPASIETPTFDPSMVGKWQFIGPIIEGKTLYVRNLVATEENGKTILYVGTGEPGRILKWSEATSSWSDIGYKLPGFGWVGALAVDPTDPKTVYAGLGAPMRLAKSTDGGENWSLIDYRHSEPRGLAISNQNPQVVYLGTQDGLLKSADGGETWKLLDNGIPTNFLFWTVAVDPDDDSFIMAGGEPVRASTKVNWEFGTFYCSQNNGESWEEVRDERDTAEAPIWTRRGPIYTIIDIEFGPENDIYVTNEGGTLFFTRDRKTWESLLPDARHFWEIEIDPTDPRILYAAGTKGVYKSIDGGKSWQDISEGLGAERTGDLTTSKDGSFLYVVCYIPNPAREREPGALQFISAGVWRLRLK